MIYSTEQDKKRVTEIVQAELSQRRMIIDENYIRQIVEDIMNISYSIGGDYSRSVITKITTTYFERDFYKKFFQD